MAYLSTQASLEAIAGQHRVKLFGDKDRDGTVDAQTLTQALQYGDQVVKSQLFPRYGSQVSAWDSDNSDTPLFASGLSDKICLHWLSESTAIGSKTISTGYTEALRMLSMIAGYQMSLPGIDDISNEVAVEEMSDPYTEEAYDSDDGKNYIIIV